MRIAKIKWAMPHCYALISFIIILVALLTWCVFPAAVLIITQ